MKTCPNCQAQLDDAVAFCPNCGTSFAAAPAPQPQPAPAPQPQPAPAPQPQPVPAPQPAPQPVEPKVNLLDHTAEFDPKDISENKVLAMVPYILGWFGIIIGLLAASESKFVSFHMKQAMKLSVIETICLVVAIIPFLGWFAIAVVWGITLVLRVIQFIRVCCGKAVEAPIVSSFGFLK